MDNVFSLTGKTAFITGSTTGIGRMLVSGLTKAGATVWGHGPDAGNLDGLDTELAGRVVTADFTRPEEIETMAAHLTQSLGQLDILINNAGIEIVMPLERWDMAIYNKTLQINLNAPVMITSLLLPLLKKSNGASVINITSVHETIPYPSNASYSMSKAALSMFTKVMALELAPHGIRVNVLAPGLVRTTVSERAATPAVQEFVAKKQPLTGGMVEAVDVARAALFLLGDASRPITGQVLKVDGGWSVTGA